MLGLEKRKIQIINPSDNLPIELSPTKDKPTPCSSPMKVDAREFVPSQSPIKADAREFVPRTKPAQPVPVSEAPSYRAQLTTSAPTPAVAQITQNVSAAQAPTSEIVQTSVAPVQTEQPEPPQAPTQIESVVTKPLPKESPQFCEVPLAVSASTPVASTDPIVLDAPKSEAPASPISTTLTDSPSPTQDSLKGRTKLCYDLTSMKSWKSFVCFLFFLF